MTVSTEKRKTQAPLRTNNKEKGSFFEKGNLVGIHFSSSKMKNKVTQALTKPKHYK